MLKVGDTIQFETSIGIIQGTIVPAYAQLVIQEGAMLSKKHKQEIFETFGLTEDDLLTECRKSSSGSIRLEKELQDSFGVGFDEHNSELLNQLYNWDSAVILRSKPKWIQIGLCDGHYGSPEYRIEPCIIKKPDENLSQPPDMPNWNMNPGFLSQWAKRCMFGDGQVQMPYDGFKITREGDSIKLSLLNDGDEWAYILLPFEPIAEGGSVTILGQPGLTAAVDGTITVNID